MGEDISHGGNIYNASRLTGLPVTDILDFSASINPLGCPETVLEALRENMCFLIGHYPEPDAFDLARAVSENTGIPQRLIVCGNGSTELIYLTVRVLKPEKVLIPAPTFSEYERAIRSTGKDTMVAYLPLQYDEDFQIQLHQLLPAIKEQDMLFLCNPNNPTGQALSRDKMITIAEECRLNECFLVVDEAFIDFSDEMSMIDLVNTNPFLIVLRSMTKFYAIPGLRIGYGVYPDHIIRLIKEHKEPWTVNALAIRAGIESLKDRDFSIRTRRMIKEEKRYIEAYLSKLNLKFFTSHANYYLLDAGTYKGLAEYLFKKGILVRNCGNFKGLSDDFIRISVRTRKENKKLLCCIEEFITECNKPAVSKTT